MISRKRSQSRKEKQKNKPVTTPIPRSYDYRFLLMAPIIYFLQDLLLVKTEPFCAMWHAEAIVTIFATRLTLFYISVPATFHVHLHVTTRKFKKWRFVSFIYATRTEICKKAFDSNTCHFLCELQIQRFSKTCSLTKQTN